VDFGGGVVGCKIIVYREKVQSVKHWCGRMFRAEDFVTNKMLPITWGEI
jgi:hypothetical protein